MLDEECATFLNQVKGSNEMPVDCFETCRCFQSAPKLHVAGFRAPDEFGAIMRPHWGLGKLTQSKTKISSIILGLSLILRMRSLLVMFASAWRSTCIKNLAASKLMWVRVFGMMNERLATACAVKNPLSQQARTASAWFWCWFKYSTMRDTVTMLWFAAFACACFWMPWRTDRDTWPARPFLTCNRKGFDRRGMVEVCAGSKAAA